MTDLKKIKIRLTEESAEELADLKIHLGLAKEEDRKALTLIYLKEMECYFG